MMNRFLLTISLIFIFAAGVFSQVKTLEDARNEIKTFTNSESYSVLYDSARYVTKAEVRFDIFEPKTPLEKQFKKFEFAISTLFATDGIEDRSVRSTLCINTQSKQFYFASERNLTLLLDGETINLGEADRSTEVKGRKVFENLCWEIDAELIKDFGKASGFEFKLANVKETLDSAKLQFFKDYAKLLNVSEVN